MRRICFVLMITVASTGMAAGLRQLIDGLQKPIPAPQPAPQPPAPPKPIKK